MRDAPAGDEDHTDAAAARLSDGVDHEPRQPAVERERAVVIEGDGGEFHVARSRYADAVPPSCGMWADASFPAPSAGFPTVAPHPPGRAPLICAPFARSAVAHRLQSNRQSCTGGLFVIMRARFLRPFVALLVALLAIAARPAPPVVQACASCCTQTVMHTAGDENQPCCRLTPDVPPVPARVAATPEDGVRAGTMAGLVRMDAPAVWRAEPPRVSDRQLRHKRLSVIRV